MSPSPTPLPAATRAYLEAPVLAPVWAAARARLERNELKPTGTLRMDLDEAAAAQLSGLLGVAVPAGAGRAIRLADLDVALRASKAGRGLVSVLESLSGETLRDRKADQRISDEQWARVWRALDETLHDEGLGTAPWVGIWVADLRRTGILTRAGADIARRAVTDAAHALGQLGRTSAPGLCTAPDEPFPGEASTQLQIGALATATTGDSHGLDDARLTSAAVLRAVAIACGLPAPASSADRRALWRMVGVATDSVSGTVLVWSLRPPGCDPWSEMMRLRADLGLVTHLTLHELERAGKVRLRPGGQVVSLCENPQVLQAAARAEVSAPLVCLSGSPAEVGTRLVRTLVGDGAPVRYHGDFDWPGIAIAARLLAVGATPWRMSAADYRRAVAGLAADVGLPLTGTPEATAWDPDLAAAMIRAGVAVHEESLLDDLLADLAL
ncbi:TIGR02679 family protein [Pseudofrankia inefficax]|nr:TIGR02679 family protein [Pseudofrankia inefficax]